MTSYVLQHNAYTLPVRGSSRNTIIEDEQQEHGVQYKPHGDDFDDLYDITEDEAETEEIPIHISSSVQNSPVVMRREKQYPSLVIPSPTAWPSIHNLEKFGQPQIVTQGMLSPPMITPKADSFSRLAKRNSGHSYTSLAPSLDESLTSDELSSSSCPPTPDVGREEENMHDWNAPVQLHPQSLMTLERLTIPDNRESQLFTLQNTEMTERGAPMLNLNTAFEIAMTPIEDELSALSIPSPGGFFSTLNPQARNTWKCPSPNEVPATTVAENFYGVPFGAAQSHLHDLPPPPPRKHVIEIAAYDDNLTEGPPTARQIPAHYGAGTPGLEALRSPEVTAEPMEYNENYVRQIRESSVANIDRTASWLNSLDGDAEDAETMSVKSVGTPLSARSVRFALEETIPEEIEEKDATFVRGFNHLQSTKDSADAFVHRKARTEKLRLDRKCLFSSHMNQLEGKYNLPSPPQVPTARNDSGLLAAEETEKLVIATAVREQAALSQLREVSWSVEATKFLNGGTLLTSPTGRIFERGAVGRVLDLGGISSCDWAWQVAHEYPNTTVHTVCTADQAVNPNIASPKNHKQTIVPNLWTLPFPSNHFDCVSARNVYALLKLNCPVPAKASADEYDLCLKECMRILRPGGYIEFALLDADLLRAGRLGSALSGTFSSNLKSRGYDSAPTKSWLPRLRKAGFGQVRRAWLVLPMSNYNASRGGTTADASHLTGMVGSWAWERWMLKLQNEMGQENKLEGVAAAMEEGARMGAAWRYLSGWARKPL